MASVLHCTSNTTGSPTTTNTITGSTTGNTTGSTIGRITTTGSIIATPPICYNVFSQLKCDSQGSHEVFILNAATSMMQTQ